MALLEKSRARAKAVLPAKVRRLIRAQFIDLPHRAIDFWPDIADRFSKNWPPLPPPRLRRAVGNSSSRKEFLEVGRAAATDILSAAREVRSKNGRRERWLDFGCGAGRLARHVVLSSEIDLWGADISAEAIAWCRRHVGRTFVCVQEWPPSQLPTGFFDVAYSVSVFSHFDELHQAAWLGEMERVLKAGGLLLASTHSESLTWSRPDLTIPQHEALARDGFLFAPGLGRFNEQSAFHTRRYLERTWGSRFVLRQFCEHGLVGYHDLSVWQKQ